MRFDHDPADLEALAAPLALLETERKTLVAPNRIVYQPMEGNDAEANGAPSPPTLRKYARRAAGGAGIDHVEAVAVSREGKARGRQLVLTEESRGVFEHLFEEYRRINETTPLLVQLTHSGRFAEEPVTPYAVEGARLLTDGDLARIQEDVVRATRLAFECGADGIDLKHCHGYLFGALLGPANRARPGWSYGGETIEERSRFFRETIARMQAEVPPDRFLYEVRLSAFEGIPGGFGSRDAESAEEDETLAELRAFSRTLEAAGVRLVNQSAGVPEITPLLVRQTNENPALFFAHQRYAEAIKREVSVPVVGSGYSYAKAGNNKLPGERRDKHVVAQGGRAIRQGQVDLIGVGRQSLADPLFARKLLAGDFGEILWDTSCNRCAVSLRWGIDAGCVTFDPSYEALFRSMEELGPPG